MKQNATYVYPMVILGVLFFVFGFITWVNGILIPYFKICLELTNFEASLVASLAYSAYFVMSIPSAWILKYTGYKKGMVLGLIVMAFGTLVFLPAAYSRTYGVFLTGLFVTGSGLALLQTAANPYVAIVGPVESTARRVGFMGLSNKVAGILSQRILGAIFLLSADDVVSRITNVSAAEKDRILDEYVLKVIDPYIVISVVLLLLSVMIYFSRLPEIKEKENEMEGVHLAGGSSGRSSVVQYPYLVLGVIALFVAGACEVIPIDGIIVYSTSIGIPFQEARFFSEYTLYAMLAGYLASVVLIPKVLSQQKALLTCSVLGMVATFGAYFSSGIMSVYFVISMGFGAAWLWGTIWGLAIRCLGKHTKMGAALLLMSVVGGGIFPPIFGALIDANPAYVQTAILLLVPCFAYLIFYSLKGYRIKSWKLIPKSVNLNHLNN